MQRALVALAVRRRALRNEFDHENVHWRDEVYLAAQVDKPSNKELGERDHGTVFVYAQI